MIIGVLESGSTLSTIFLQKYKSQITKHNIHEVTQVLTYDSTSDEKKANKKEFLSSIESYYTHKPFIGNKFLLIIDIKYLTDTEFNEILTNLKSNEHLIAILRLRSRTLWDTLSQQKDITLLNTFQPPSFLILEHLRQNLQKAITYSTVEYLTNHLKGQYQYIDNYIAVLNSLDIDIITERIIVDNIPKRSNIRIEDITHFILTGEKKKKAYAALYTFRYAHKFIRKDIKKTLETLIEIKQDYLAGYVSDQNLVDFNKKYKVSPYTLERYFNQYVKEISLEKMYRILHLYTNREEDNLNLLLRFGSMYRWGNKWTDILMLK